MAPSETSALEKPVIPSSDRIDCPYPPLDGKLSDEDLQHTAYEIFLATTKVYTHGKPALKRWKSRNYDSKHSPENNVHSGSGLVKRAFGTGFSRQVDNGTRSKGRSTVADIVRVHLNVSEDYDAILRRALAKSDAQKGFESELVPMKLLQNVQSSDFSSSEDHELWQKRQLRVLEAGLLLHPKVAFNGTDLDFRQLKLLFKEFSDKSVENIKAGKSMQTLRTKIVELAYRAGENETEQEVCHWADGFPLNMHLYQMLVESCVDLSNGSATIDETEEEMNLIRKTWDTLGITENLHTVCLIWALFHRFVVTKQKELQLLAAIEMQLNNIQKDAKSEWDPVMVKVLPSVLGTVLAWAEKRLLAYHDTFPHGGSGSMESILLVSIMAAQILNDKNMFEFRLKQKEQGDVASTKINLYIRSSLRTAFAQMMEEADGKRTSKGLDSPLPTLAALAGRITELAKNEREKFSPIFRKWHNYPAAVAAATLHACYCRELQQFFTRVKILTPEVVKVAGSAEQLEKDLVQIAVEDTVDSEDGGKKIVREMSPFDVISVIEVLSQKWVVESVAKLSEWVDRNVKNEEWSPHSLREHYALSAVEVLRMVEETLDAFFSLPISQYPHILQDLVNGVDRGLQLYVSQTVGTFGSGKDFIPALPPLTRWNKESSKSHGKLGSHWWKKDINKKENKTLRSNDKLGSQISDMERFCVRINTLSYLQEELEGFEKKLKFGWQKSLSKISEIGKQPALLVNQSKTPRFALVRKGCKQGIQELMEIAVYKAVYQNMRSVFWDGLYSGGVGNSRIDQVIPFLDAYLETIATTVFVKLRNKFVTALMRTSFEVFLLVLLAGGPSRAFEPADAEILEEDFLSLKDLFKADGDGLPEEIVENAAKLDAQILPLFAMETSNLIDCLRAASSQKPVSILSSNVSPSPAALWNPNDASTLLRVLCYRADAQATRFLRKTYKLPKR